VAPTGFDTIGAGGAEAHPNEAASHKPQASRKPQASHKPQAASLEPQARRLA
jgi:hypothetical protein